MQGAVRRGRGKILPLLDGHLTVDYTEGINVFVALGVTKGLVTVTGLLFSYFGPRGGVESA